MRTEVNYLFWQEDDAWLGYLQDYPDYWTQGESLDDLVDHLRDLYLDLSGGKIPGARKLGGADHLMKRVDLIKSIEAMGCELTRHGGKHDWDRNPTTRMSQAVLRHREIKERLALKIIESLSVPRPGASAAGKDA